MFYYSIGVTGLNLWAACTIRHYHMKDRGGGGDKVTGSTTANLSDRGNNCEGARWEGNGVEHGANPAVLAYLNNLRPFSPRCAQPFAEPVNVNFRHEFHPFPLSPTTKRRSQPRLEPTILKFRGQREQKCFEVFMIGI